MAEENFKLKERIAYVEAENWKLKEENWKLKEENWKLKERIAYVEAKATCGFSAKNKLISELVAATSASATSAERSMSSEDWAALKGKIEELQAQTSEVPASTKELVQTKVSVHDYTN